MTNWAFKNNVFKNLGLAFMKKKQINFDTTLLRDLKNLDIIK